jgi:hypothetical protein
MPVLPAILLVALAVSSGSADSVHADTSSNGDAYASASLATEGSAWIDYVTHPQSINNPGESFEVKVSGGYVFPSGNIGSIFLEILYHDSRQPITGGERRSILVLSESGAFNEIFSLKGPATREDIALVAVLGMSGTLVDEEAFTVAVQRLGLDAVYALTIVVLVSAVVLAAARLAVARRSRVRLARRSRKK